MLWNTVHMARVVVARVRVGATTPGETVALEDRCLAYLWPRQCARVIPNGSYFLA